MSPLFKFIVILFVMAFTTAAICCHTALLIARS
jgi:hypothetical protein